MMRSMIAVALTAGSFCTIAAPARADGFGIEFGGKNGKGWFQVRVGDPRPAPAPCPPACEHVFIPAHQVCRVERVREPAVWEDRCVPVYEDRCVPVFEWRVDRWGRKQRIQVGTRTERVQVGTRTERVCVQPERWVERVREEWVPGRWVWVCSVHGHGHGHGYGHRHQGEVRTRQQVDEELRLARGGRRR
jgi:hypothetical protein